MAFSCTASLLVRAVTALPVQRYSVVTAANVAERQHRGGHRRDGDPVEDAAPMCRGPQLRVVGVRSLVERSVCSGSDRLVRRLGQIRAAPLCARARLLAGDCGTTQIAFQ